MEPYLAQHAALEVASAASRSSARTLLDQLASRNLLSVKISLFDYEGGVMFVWSKCSLYCDIDADGTFEISRAAEPDADGFVAIKSATFKSAEETAKCLYLLL